MLLNSYERSYVRSFGLPNMHVGFYVLQNLHVFSYVLLNLYGRSYVRFYVIPKSYMYFYVQIFFFESEKKWDTSELSYNTNLS